MSKGCRYLGCAILSGLMAKSGLAAATPKYPLVEVPFGYSATLEFREPPMRAAPGDRTAFSVERAGARILVWPTREDATTNLSFFFATGDLFTVLVSSKNSEPRTLEYKFDFPAAPPPPPPAPATGLSARPQAVRIAVAREGVTVTLLRATFTAKRDYLNVSVEIKNSRKGSIEPGFSVAAVTNGEKFVTATRAKSDRRSLQPGATVQAHFEFTRPDLANDLRGIRLVLPIRELGRFELPLSRGPSPEGKL